MRINSIYRSVIGQSIYNRYNSSHNHNVGLHPKAGQPAADGYNTRPASQSKMDTIHNQPVSLQCDSYSIQGWPVHNPNIGLHTRAGQPAADGYTQDWPVSQRWIQYTTGQSVYNEIHIQYRASQSNSNGQQLQLASQIEMGNVTSGQSINHGDNKVTGHLVWDPMQASSGGPSYMGNCQVGWLV